MRFAVITDVYICNQFVEITQFAVKSNIKLALEVEVSSFIDVEARLSKALSPCRKTRQTTHKRTPKSNPMRSRKYANCFTKGKRINIRLLRRPAWTTKLSMEM